MGLEQKKRILAPPDLDKLTYVPVLQNTAKDVMGTRIERKLLIRL
jgi:hypothetical protein